MKTKVLLVTPPFTQLNTPYPATTYLKGFLNTKKIETYQCDLGIEVILRLFTTSGLQNIFSEAQKSRGKKTDNIRLILSLKEYYLQTIEAVISFLQNKNPTLAHTIADRSYLPEAGRFSELDDLEWAFGTMGIQDRARHLATLYLEDLGDLIKETVDIHFGFSRYAEKLGSTASHFNQLHKSLIANNSFVSHILIQLLEEKLQQHQPSLVCLSVPFPGNLFAALKCGQFIKQQYPSIKVALGGGYANTELRSLCDPKVFCYVDYVSLDDGEATLLTILEHTEKKRKHDMLKRVFVCKNEEVLYCNGATEPDVAQKDTGTPDYSDLLLADYLSVIEIANPMHRLWSDGRWNKLTLAHGCYWGKCSFCDISLAYIKNYEPLTASLLCDRIESIIKQTGQNGFHFVDEAAPPKLLRELALEILRRKITVVWWANIRFEKTFTHDLSRLLKASGCIAVSGGLEVASDRLLKLMNKGVTVAQVAQVTDGFTQAGIMVHAYLMYGFPTQTTQETIDSLEMVRQLFETGVVQSGFWHRFAMTAHSPIGLRPQNFGVNKTGPAFGGFAKNDLFHEDSSGAEHDLFAEGLRKSLFNYMHGVGFDFHLQEWFDTNVPETTVISGYIEQCLGGTLSDIARDTSTMVWIDNLPQEIPDSKSNKNNTATSLLFNNKKSSWKLTLEYQEAAWLQALLIKINLSTKNTARVSDVKLSYEKETGKSFNYLVRSSHWKKLRENGLLIL